MSTPVAAYDLAPLAGVVAVGTLIALVPLAWTWRKRRADAPALRLQAFAWLVLFLTFDLVLLGAYTRLSDSGLGCPDWPGCYGHASPIGASSHIAAAEATVPTGPVTASKAWVEMLHRYAATAIGILVIALFVLALREARRSAGRISARWAFWTLVWICMQGAFGALTVTMKLYPLIVTLHLLGGMVLLVLLAVQVARASVIRIALPRSLWFGALAIAVLSALQIALGGWVSTNYAVLACSGFPSCQGSWWPQMDFEHGFALLRELGSAKDGGALPFAALTAIHYVHRLVAYVLLLAMAVFAWRLHAHGLTRPWASATAGIALWQLASGLSNVVLGWPLLGAVAHTAGAAAWVTLLTLLIAGAQAVPETAFRRMHAFP